MLVANSLLEAQNKPQNIDNLFNDDKREREAPFGI